MSNIQQLEKQLEKAKKEEKANYLKKECEEVRKQYEGKAFGSRTFERDSKAAIQSAIYIKRVYLGKAAMSDTYGILADIYSIHVSSHDSGYKFSKENYSYSRHHNQEEQLTNERYNASYMIHQRLPYHYKEIPVEKFTQLWGAADEFDIVVKEPFSKNVEPGYSELIRGGDSSREGRIEDAIKEMKLEIIDVQTKYPVLWEAIKYADLPMFQNNKWMPSVFAKQILEHQIARLQKEMASPFCTGRSYEAKQRDVNIIRDHLNIS